MELPEEVDNYIRESIDQTLGLPMSMENIQLKLMASQEANHRLRSQYYHLLVQLKEKEQTIESAKAEASMNAMAVKRFVEENQRLAEECRRLLSDCSKLEKECSLYDHDREALMDFGNEADERAREAESRAHDLEIELAKVLEELNFYKTQFETSEVDSAAEDTAPEEILLESVLATLVSKDELKSGRAFLEDNSESESCETLLSMWDSLKPSTQKVLSLAGEAKALRMNLATAEQEASLLFEENKVLVAENKRLLKLHQRGSGGKHSTSASAKTNKRKSSPRMNSPPYEKKVNFDLDSAVRQPLSPLRDNSPDDSRKY